MSSPRSLFEIIEQDEFVLLESEEPMVEECNDEVVTECNDTCYCYNWLIILISLLAIFIIYYFGNRCDNNDWFDKHHNSSWVAYSGTINLWWSILIIVLAYSALRIYCNSYGQTRNMLMIIYILLIVLSVIQVYSVLELRNYTVGFWLALLLILLSFVLLAYSWRIDQSASILIILFIIWLLYVCAVSSCDEN